MFSNLIKKKKKNKNNLFFFFFLFKLANKNFLPFNIIVLFFLFIFFANFEK